MHIKDHTTDPNEAGKLFERGSVPNTQVPDLQGSREAIIAGMAMALAEMDGVEPEQLHDVVWEGSPIPEPWGAVWQKYEPQAEKLFKVVLNCATAAPNEGQPNEQNGSSISAQAQTERERFEQWVGETIYAQDSSSFHNDLYEAWRARAALSRESAAMPTAQQNHLVAAPVSLPSEQHGLSGAVIPIPTGWIKAQLMELDGAIYDMANKGFDAICFGTIQRVRNNLAVTYEDWVDRSRRSDSASPSAALQGETLAATKAVSPQAQGSGKPVGYINSNGDYRESPQEAPQQEPAAMPNAPEPVAWIRKTDITELTDSEPETDGWTPLFAAAQPAVSQGERE